MRQYLVLVGIIACLLVTYISSLMGDCAMTNDGVWTCLAQDVHIHTPVHPKGPPEHHRHHQHRPASRAGPHGSGRDSPRKDPAAHQLTASHVVPPPIPASTAQHGALWEEGERRRAEADREASKANRLEADEHLLVASTTPQAPAAAAEPPKAERDEAEAPAAPHPANEVPGDVGGAPRPVPTPPIPNASLWVTGAVTSAERPWLPKPATVIARALWLRLRDPDNGTTASIGHLQDAVVFCEYFSVSFAVWMLDCLPRLVRALPLLRSRPGLLYILPGESLALQYAVEVLGLPEAGATLLPSHLLWGPQYPNYYLSMAAMHHVPRLTDAPALRSALQAVRQVIGRWLARRPQPPRAALRVLFSQRLDMTMPVNHTDLLLDVCRRLRGAVCHSVRFETLSVAQQIELAARTDVLLGPPGANLLSLLHMRAGTLVLELYPTAAVRVPAYTMDAPRLQYHMYEGEHSRAKGRAQELCEWAGLQYRQLFASEEIEHKKQPVFDAEKIAEIVRKWQAGRQQETALTEAVPEMPGTASSDALLLSPPLIQCSGLFHLRKTYRLLGTFKDTYFVPSKGFALKVANSAANRKRAAASGFVGDWKTLQRVFALPHPFYA